MSQPAGAPPPRPRPQSYFHRLPAELILDVVQYLHSDHFVRFALAYYPLLQLHGLAPPLSAETYRRVVLQAPLQGRNRIPPRWRLPFELTEQILQYLAPAERLNMLFSHRDLIWQYLPELSQETKDRLWKATDE
jgi:hypothetical protein